MGMNWLTLIVVQVIVVAAPAVAASDEQMFLVSFFPNMTENNLYFTSCDPGTCSVSYDDGRRRSLAVKLPGDGAVSVNLITSAQIPYGRHQSNKAVLVNCTVSTSVFAQQYDHSNKRTDAYAVIPIGSDFTDYIVPSAPIGYALTAFAALFSHTEVSIMFKSTCLTTFYGSHVLSGETLILNLDALDVITLGNEMSGNSTCDMGGTRIKSNKPIAVYSGATSLHYQTMAQIFPTFYWGSQFVIPTTFGSSFNRIRVTALDNGTSVNLASLNRSNNETSYIMFQLEGGERHDSHVSNMNTIVNSNNPVQVSRYVTNDGKHMVGTTIPATNTYKTNYTITTMYEGNNLFSSYLNIVTSLNCDSDIELSDKWKLFDPPTWTRIGSSNFIMANVALFEGPLKARSRSGRCPFSLEMMGYGVPAGEAYGYSAFQECHHVDRSNFATTETTHTTNINVTASPVATPFSKLPNAQISSSQLRTSPTSPTTSVKSQSCA